MRLFVIATGTGIGKTFITAGITRALCEAGDSVRALKPVISGYDESTIAESDTGILLQAMGLALDASSIDACSPWRFAAPLSPDMAAAREGRAIDFTALVNWSREVLAGPQDHVLIEGVGGVMVPLDNTHTVLDWIAPLDISVLLIAGSYLGTLSHTLTALEVLKARGIPIAALILNESDESPVSLEEIQSTIARFFPTLKIVKTPRNKALSLNLIDILK
jgi:dethiobiotin synthetase